MSEPRSILSIWVKASVRPSGDHDSGLCMLPVLVNNCDDALRFAGIVHIVMVPVFQERNVNRSPSGVHTGQWLVPSKLIFSSTPRARSYVWMSCDGPSISIAIFRASGEIRGC